MENNYYKDNISQIYLIPKKNPQIRIGTSYQAAIPNTENVATQLENSPLNNSHDIKHICDTNIERVFKYSENQIYVQENYKKNENKNDFVKPGKKRRIEK